MSLRIAAVAAGCALLLSGCASAPRPPPAAARALEHNRIGLEALARGDPERARESFEQALRLERSIERETGIALDTLNLSVAYQRLGRHDEAEHVLDVVLDDAVREYPPELEARVAFRKAVLRMAARDARAAASALDRARQTCGGQCGLEAGLYNLEARLALEAGDARSAEALAARAYAHGEGDTVEQANALRLRAAALLAAGDAAGSLAAAGQALELDKGLANSAKIQQDLLLLAEASRQDPEHYRAFLSRAAAVARARGDTEAARHIDAKLDPNAAVPEGDAR